MSRDELADKTETAPVPFRVTFFGPDRPTDTIYVLPASLAEGADSVAVSG
jgi:hypothetical protein